MSEQAGPGGDLESDFRNALSIGAAAQVIKDLNQRTHVVLVRSRVLYALDGNNNCLQVPRWKVIVMEAMLEEDLITVGDSIRVRYGLDQMWAMELQVAAGLGKYISAMAKKHAATMLENHWRRTNNGA